MTNAQVIERLKEGNNRFVADQNVHGAQDTGRRSDLTAGQQPFAIVLSCADSRVVPEIAFDTGLGELFVVRVAGNVANTSSLASMEYAVAHCGTEVIVVMGHENCGAVTAAIQGGDNGSNINHLLEHIQPAISESESDAVNDVVKQNVASTIQSILSQSNIIKSAVDEGRVSLHGAYYNLGSGKVDFL